MSLAQLVMPGLGLSTHALDTVQTALVQRRAEPGYDAGSTSLPSGTTAWIVSDGKIGDEVQCFGIAEALGLLPGRRLIGPRRPWRWLAPYAPISPRDAP